MQLEQVESSMLAAIGYTPEFEALVVLYNSGRAYQYLGVSAEIYQKLMAASSKGRFMLDHVIDHYPYGTFRGWENLKLEANIRRR